jgi:hypothetical protein
MKLQNTIALLAILVIVSCAKQPLEVKGDTVLLNFALSPNGDRLAVFDNTGAYILELSSKNRFELKKFDDKSFSDLRSGAVAFSPNGEHIAFSGKFADQSLDTKSNKYITSIEPPSGNYATEMEFSPNGQSLIVRSEGGYGNKSKVSCESLVDTLTLYNLEKGTNLFEISQCAFLPVQFSFTASNKLFLYQGTMSSESGYFIYLVDSNSGQLVSKNNYTWDRYGGNLYNVSPDGKYYFVEKAGFTHLLDSVSEKEVKVVEGDVVFFHDIDNFVVSDFQNKKSNFVRNDEIRCTLEGIYFAPHARVKRKVSANQEVFAISQELGTNLQVWDISSCEKIAEWLFER